MPGPRPHQCHASSTFSRPLDSRASQEGGQVRPGGGPAGRRGWVRGRSQPSPLGERQSPCGGPGGGPHDWRGGLRGQ